MLVREIMTPAPDRIPASTMLMDAAQLMRQKDVGVLLVEEDDRLVGVLTDRDIVINAVAEKKNPSTTSVTEAMTAEIRYLFDDQDVEEAAENFSQNAVRRMPVVDRNKDLVGIVSLGDLADKGMPKTAGDTLQDIVRA